jgi:3-dehydroquinate dehydratase-2
VYGTATLAEIDASLHEAGAAREATIVTRQSNHEGDLVDWIQERASEVDGWLVNAGGLTHTSIALRDALVASGRPFVEVHLSNVHAREPFRHDSTIADAALGVVSGFGASSYLLGLEGLLDHLAATT